MPWIQYGDVTVKIFCRIIKLDVHKDFAVHLDIVKVSNEMGDFFMPLPKEGRPGKPPF